MPAIERKSLKRFERGELFKKRKSGWRVHLINSTWDSEYEIDNTDARLLLTSYNPVLLGGWCMIWVGGEP